MKKLYITLFIILFALSTTLAYSHPLMQTFTITESGAIIDGTKYNFAEFGTSKIVIFNENTGYGALFVYIPSAGVYQLQLAFGAYSTSYAVYSAQALTSTNTTTFTVADAGVYLLYGYLAGDTFTAYLKKWDGTLIASVSDTKSAVVGYVRIASVAVNASYYVRTFNATTDVTSLVSRLLADMQGEGIDVFVVLKTNIQDIYNVKQDAPVDLTLVDSGGDTSLVKRLFFFGYNSVTLNYSSPFTTPAQGEQTFTNGIWTWWINASTSVYQYGETSTTPTSNETTTTTNLNHVIRVEAYDYYTFAQITGASVYLNNSKVGETFNDISVTGNWATLKVSHQDYYDFLAKIVLSNTTYYVYLKPKIVPNNYYYVEFQVFRLINGKWETWSVPIIIDNSIHTESFQQIRLKQGVHKAYINSQTGKCYQYYITFNLQSNMTIPIYVDTNANVTVVVDKDANETTFTTTTIGEKPAVGNWIGFELVNKRNSTVNVAIIMHYTKFTSDTSVTLTTFQMQSNSITYYTISVADITDILLKTDITNPFTGNDATNTYYDVVVDGTPIVEGVPYSAVKNNYFRVEISDNANAVYNANATSGGWLQELGGLGLIGLLIAVVIILKLLDKL